MNPTPTPHWSPMVPGPEDEFANFLDFGDLNFSAFGDASSAPINGAGGDPQVQDGDEGAMDTTMEGGSVVGMLGSDIEQMGDAGPISSLNDFQESFSDMETSAGLLQRRRQQQQQQHQQQQQQQQQRQARQDLSQTQHPRYYGHNPVPPTPNSLELHGVQPDFYQNHVDRQQQLIYEHYRRQQNEQMNFTPLVSPAVTPLDTQFQNSEYAASADCFSPLTSPALRAQNQSAQHPVYSGVRGSDTSDTTSPIELNHEYTAPTSGTITGSLKKTKRTASSGSIKNPIRTVRQSPVVKPQSRRKQPTSTVIPPKEVAGILEEAEKSRRATSATSDGKLSLPYGQDSSGPDSVSPEPLSEILMPPPATPKSNSAGRSPYLSAKDASQPQAPSSIGTKEAPATPASLMKIRKQAGKAGAASRTSSNLKEQALLAEADMEQIMQDLPNPETTSNSKKPALKPINTNDANGKRPAGILASARLPTATSGPVNTNGSAFPSPVASAITSPQSGSNLSRVPDTNKPKIREARKRNSTSNQISPALRPKISPSIKPLLPEGAIVSPETSALLLASKSNYQNILEGNHLPGVSYPETLSTNLTSKRTSHKIAEQGRRNRINTALQEIASLLPPQTPSSKAQNSPAGQAALMMTTGTTAQQNNSKASTVELAIDYIKSLQSELKTVKEKLKSVEDQRIKDAAVSITKDTMTASPEQTEA